MLALVIHIGKETYALPSKEIIEIVPAVELKKLLYSADYIAGVLNYRGQPAPVIDLTMLLTKRVAKHCLSTRIVLVSYFSKHTQQTHALGLMAEGISDTLLIEEKYLMPSGLDSSDALYLGSLVVNTEPMMQLIEVSHLLPAELQKQLFILPSKQEE